MIKILWAFLFMHSFAYAKPLGINGCGIYSFQGIPKITENKMILLINQSTLSEISIPIPKIEEQKFAPYINIVTKGDVEIEKFTDHRTVTPKSFSKLDYGLPNTHSVKNNFISLKARQKCR